ncbi:hypothetical protein OF83DRAFT_1067589 [Amylostereum chailletii]|nr:hypothetical protein OF83DRAFT_1067589 [Amylostereum chailletii]
MNIGIYDFAYLYLLICVYFPFGRAQQTFFPSTVPLFFRSPYLYSYLTTAHGTTHSHRWPRITGASLGWTGLVKVDNGTTYLWSGSTYTVAGTNDTVVKYFTVTPTRTIFTIQAGPLELNITYLSPIEPDDFVKQSIPFSYLAFEARSTDGSPHHMQVYTGVTGGESSSLFQKCLTDHSKTEWLSSDHTQNLTWATTPTTNGSQIHSFSYSTPQEFHEGDGLASWGTLYYATRQLCFVTHVLHLASDILTGNGGDLSHRSYRTQPRAFHRSRTSLTFAHDLGTIESTSSPIAWAFGHTFDSDNTSAIQYQDLSGNPPQRRSLYYVTQYSDDYTLIDDFLNDFPAALDRAIKLDANLTNAAASTIPGTEYSNLIALAARQVMGFTSLTVSKGSDGSWNESDVMMFWRDVDNGTPEASRQANPPDGLYASFPMFLYLNPSFGAPLLEPLLRFQDSPAYTQSNPYAAANLATERTFPPSHTYIYSIRCLRCTESANMIILSYAQARAAGDTSLIGSLQYELLKTWADYLLTPKITVFNNGQTSADGLSIANQTNLAIKGIIAIKAMSMIATLTGNTADATTYSNKSQDLYTEGKSHALADDGHMLLAYGADGSSFSLGYNVFADLWLGTGVVDSDVTSGLSRQVNNLLSFGTPYTQYGLPTDSTATDQVQSAWNMFIAAAVNDSETRNQIILRVYGRVAMNTTVVNVTTPTWLYPLTWSSTNLTAISESGNTRYASPFS